MKHFLIILTLSILLLTTVSCEETADDKQRKATEKQMQEAEAQVGMPAIVNFKERKDMKMILELRDQEDMICYAYIVNLEGKLIFMGKCMGYGLPYSVQFTNPEKRVRHTSGNSYNLPQPDPNGLFMPEGLSATWLMMIDSNNEPRPVYIEPEIIVSPFPLH